MTVFNHVHKFAQNWENASGYKVSGNMVVAVTQVILAADPHGASTDDPEYLKEATERILNAALVPDNETPKQTPKWFVIQMSRIPTNFSNPFRVAIEANDKKHAAERLGKLYDDNYCRTAHAYTNNDEECMSETADKDILHGCRKHPL